MKTTRDENGNFPAYAWPGGYPIVYVMADGETICADCANGGSGSIAAVDHEEKEWRIIGCNVHWEGEPETCAHCGKQVESAYGEPD